MTNSRRIIVFGIAALSAFLMATTNALAAPGDVDTTFGVAGTTTTTNTGVFSDQSIVRQSSGELAAAWASGTNIGVTGYSSDGVLDTGFGTGGSGQISVPGTDSIRATDAILDGSERIVVAGYTNQTVGNDRMVVARFTQSGSPDTSFSGDGVLTIPFTQGNVYGYGLNVLSNGKIVIVGEVDPNGSSSNPSLAMVKPSGVLDSTFGSGGTKMVKVKDGVADYDGLWRVQSLSKGRFVAAGWDSNGSTYDTLVMQFLGSGKPDTNFGGGDGLVIVTVNPTVDDWAYGLTRVGSKIVLGIAGDNLHPAVVRLLGSGKRDKTFGTNGVALFSLASYFRPYEVAVDPTGRIVVVSDGANLPTMRLLSNGDLDTGYGTLGFATDPATSATGKDLLLQGSKAVVVGQTTNTIALTRYLG